MLRTERLEVRVVLVFMFIQATIPLLMRALIRKDFVRGAQSRVVQHGIADPGHRAWLSSK